jgi:hypothetical protein
MAGGEGYEEGFEIWLIVGQFATVLIFSLHSEAIARRTEAK